MKKLILFFLLILINVLLLGGCGGGNLSLEGKWLQFETTDIDGNPVNSVDLFSQHEITMLNLWGTWCGPCIQELPELEKVSQKLAEMDGAVVGLLNDGKGGNDVELAKRYLSENGVTYLNILSPENMDEAITHQSYYPMTLFVNRKGVVIGKTLLGTTSQKYMVDYYVGAAKEALKSGK
ncbi:MAG: TlpA family protein disulfide reductase [Anaerolineaceae bacterium]|nr:TlpA family protein disulfide reductase [Anaerolineaceae bacterium]